MFLTYSSELCENFQQVPGECNVSQALQLPQGQREDIHIHRQRHFQLLQMSSQQNAALLPKREV